MEVANSDLKAWLEENSFLESALFSKVQQLSPKVFKFKLSTSRGAKDLVYFNGKALWVTSLALAAPEKPSNFSLYLRKRLQGLRVLSLKLHGFDRIVTFSIGKNNVVEFFLVFELFGSGNLVLTDLEGKVLTALEMRAWKDREISRGKNYEYPLSGGKQEWFPRTPVLAKFNSLNEAFDDVLRADVEGELSSESSLEKKQKSLEARLRQQEQAVQKFQKLSVELKRKGDAVFENYALVEGLLRDLNAARRKKSWGEIKAMLEGAKENAVAKRVREVRESTGKVLVDL